MNKLLEVKRIRDQKDEEVSRFDKKYGINLVKDDLVVEKKLLQVQVEQLNLEGQNIIGDLSLARSKEHELADCLSGTRISIKQSIAEILNNMPMMEQARLRF